METTGKKHTKNLDTLVDDINDTGLLTSFDDDISQCGSNAKE